MKREAEKEQQRLHKEAHEGTGARAAPARNSCGGDCRIDCNTPKEGSEGRKGLARWLPKWLNLKGGSIDQASKAGGDNAGLVGIEGHHQSAPGGRRRWAGLSGKLVGIVGGRKGT